MQSKHDYHSLVKGIIISNSNRAAAYVTRKEKEKNFDPNKQVNDRMKAAGRKWCVNGNTLDDADESLRNNPFFVEGYEAMMQINYDAYEEGFNWFIYKRNMENVPENYLNSKYFMQGYSDAVSQSLIDGIDWTNIHEEFSDDSCFNLDDEFDSSVKKHR